MLISINNAPAHQTFANLNNGAAFIIPGKENLFIKTLSFGDPKAQFNTIEVGSGRRCSFSGPTEIVPVKLLDVQL